jgi:hypothetical protein
MIRLTLACLGFESVPVDAPDLFNLGLDFLSQPIPDRSSLVAAG